MRRLALRRWVWVHKWSSLVCTVFLLVICLTGLLLLFDDEIGAFFSPPDNAFTVVPPDTPRASLDYLTAQSRQMYPGQIIVAMAIGADKPSVSIFMAPSWEVLKSNPLAQHGIRFDARTGTVLGQINLSNPRALNPADRILNTIYTLHTTLFTAMPGRIFLVLIALLFVTAIVSGLTIYGPFMRKLDFGTVRAERTARLKWLDLHNLLGVVTVAWVLVVAATGIMNELSIPLFATWENTYVRQALSQWQSNASARPGREPSQASADATIPVVPQADLSSVQAAYDTALRAIPNSVVTGIAFPRPAGVMDPAGGSSHYLLWTHGATPLTARLFNPALIDARTGALTAVVKMPWYLRTLEVSRPLHFGDYGGMPLKIIWALLDLVTIVVLGSGLYLWLSRRKSPIEARLSELEALEAEASSVPAAE